MEAALTIAVLIAALITSLIMLAAEVKKGKQIEGLKDAIREQEINAMEKDVAELSDADITTIVDFLNGLSKDRTGPDKLRSAEATNLPGDNMDGL